jgi:hypothetical protein
MSAGCGTTALRSALFVTSDSLLCLFVYTHRCMYDYMYIYAHARALLKLSSPVAPGVNKEFVIIVFVLMGSE